MWPGLVLALGCGSASTPPGADVPPAAASGAAPSLRAQSAAPEIEVLAREPNDVPGSDAVPRVRLAFRMADGSRRPIDGEALAYVPFRDGVALLDTRRQLVLVSPSGERRVLVREAGAPPAIGPRGELLYVAQEQAGADVHALDLAGNHRWLARGLASAGLLAPQKDGRVLLVAARHGGVAGVWLAGEGDSEQARCLSNCELATGAGDPQRTQPWAGFVPLPSSADSLRVRGERAEWQAADGAQHGAALQGRLPVVEEPGAVPATGSNATRGDEP